MWNDTDLPLAYLITFRCYGTWVHGDERGSIDRFHNVYRFPHIPPNKNWKQHNTRQLRSEPVTLDAAQRRSVECAIREVCAFRRWVLYALSVRTNHVHVVASIGTIKPERALNAFKGYATRLWTEPSQYHLRERVGHTQYAVDSRAQDIPTR